MKRKQLVQEERGGEVYTYYPLGEYIVAAPGVCGGRPTFKYTRLEVAIILDLLGSGWTIDDVRREYARSALTSEAITEAVRLAREALVRTTTVARAR